MTYEEEIKEYLNKKGVDSQLFNSFLEIETVEFINKDSILKFSLWGFIQKLHQKGFEDKSIHELSEYYNNNLSLNGCFSLRNHLSRKMIIFNRLNRFLNDKFIEFKCLGEMDSQLLDNTIPELNNKIIKHKKTFNIYLNWIFESMNLHKVQDYDVIFNKISNHFFNQFQLEKMTARELTRFNTRNANPDKIKKNILEFIKSENQR